MVGRFFWEGMGRVHFWPEGLRGLDAGPRALRSSLSSRKRFRRGAVTMLRMGAVGMSSYPGSGYGQSEDVLTGAPGITRQ